MLKRLGVLCLAQIKSWLSKIIDSDSTGKNKLAFLTFYKPLRISTVSLGNLGVHYGVNGRASLQPIWATDYIGSTSKDSQSFG